jgi:hypothetical protein
VNSRAERTVPSVRRSQGRHEDASGVLLAGLSVGLIFIAILLVLVDRWAPGVFVTDERVELIIVGMLLGCGVAAVRHYRHPRGRRSPPGQR